VRDERSGVLIGLAIYWLDSNFDRRVWQKARTKAKLPELTFHTLRHFYISMVRAQGLPNAITEQLVGHVDERTDWGYTRPIPGTESLIRAAPRRHSAQPGNAQPDR
jgi:integrase